MQKIKTFLIWNLILLLPTATICEAKVKIKEKTVAPPMCSNTGEISCPKGYKLNCPKQYKPACVFVGTSQLPACLADSADNTFFSYDLNKISCQK